MKLWNITIGEPLPTDSGHPRLYRSGIISQMAVDRGDDVIWWTSTVDHHTRCLRFNSNTCQEIQNKFSIQILHGGYYKKNISVARLVNHWQIAKQFSMLCRSTSKPDLIYCSFPDIFLAEAAVRYGLEFDVPVVVDVRDLWPDLFLDILPGWARPIGRLMLFSLYSRTKYVFRHATAILGVTESMVAWGQRKSGGRIDSEFDSVFPMAYPDSVCDQASIEIAQTYWRDNFGITQGQIIVCFLGTIGHHFDLETVIRAAGLRELRAVKFVFCGDGDLLSHYKTMSQDLKNVIFPGWVGTDKMQALIRLSQLGLAPYNDSVAFTDHIPNKPIEYMGGGLPVLTCLKGALGTLLIDNRCGFTYEFNDVESFANTLQTCLADKPMMDQYSTNAKRLYTERFRADDVYGRLLEHFDQVVDQHTSRK